MSVNPLKETLNRAKQIKSAKGDLKQSITLFDIDYAMMTHLEDTILPTLDDNGKALKIFTTTFTKAGRHIFNLIVDNPTDFASGVYILRLHTPRGMYHVSMVHKK